MEFFPSKTVQKLFGIVFKMKNCLIAKLILLHSEWPKLHRVLAVLSAKGLTGPIYMLKVILEKESPILKQNKDVLSMKYNLFTDIVNET